MFWIEFFGVFVLWFLENNVAIDFITYIVRIKSCFYIDFDALF